MFCYFHINFVEFWNNFVVELSEISGHSIPFGIIITVKTNGGGIDMSKIKFYYVKYKSMKLILGFSNYNFDYYSQYLNGGIMLILNNDLKDKSKLLHKIIRFKDLKRNMNKKSTSLH